jgi:hypothetical protein
MIIFLMVVALAIGIGIGVILPRRSPSADIAPSAQEPNLHSAPKPDSVRTDAPSQQELEIRRLVSYALAASHVSRATFILEKYLQDKPEQAQPVIWHMLMDIYHGSGNRAQFDELHERYRARFQQNLPAFNDWKQHFSTKTNLERSHPELLAELNKIQSKQEALNFIDTLIKDSVRPGRPSYNLLDAEQILRIRDELQEASRVTLAQTSKLAETRADSKMTMTGRHDAIEKTIAKATAAGTVRSTPDIKTQPNPAITDVTTSIPGSREKPHQILPAAEALCALEGNYPRIINKLQTLWPNESCDKYLDSLIIDDRGGRQGFNPSAMSEILFLKEIMQIYHPSKQDVWNITK